MPVRGRPLSRGQVLGYRAAVHGLEESVGLTDCAASAVGFQDSPIGATARLALHSRGLPGDQPGLVLAHSIRGAAHLHLQADLALLAAAVRVDAQDLAPQQVGRLPAVLAAAGGSFGAALDAVASAMRQVVPEDGVLTKGELSGAVTARVDRNLAPWCANCDVFHVDDVLFRFATLQAHLVIAPDCAPSTCYRRYPGGEPADFTSSARELVRRFLRACGPAKPAQLAAWLGLSTVGARRMWSLVASELVPVDLEGWSAFAHAGGGTARSRRDQRDMASAAYRRQLEHHDRAVPEPCRRGSPGRRGGGPRHRPAPRSRTDHLLNGGPAGAPTGRNSPRG